MPHDLWDLIDTIFQDLNPEEHVVFSSKADREYKDGKGTPTGPTLATSLEGFKKTLRGSKQRATYVGTSTMRLDEEGNTRNRQNLLEGLFFFVLDDVGTGPGAKCHKDDLPPGVWDKASYRILTSPDNYQLGFILREPIRNPAHAREFIKLIYARGPWDRGGAQPTKWVRIPGSHNCKNMHGPHGNRFEAVLEHFPDDVPDYSPEELLALLDVGVSWDDITSGMAAKREPRRSRGTTAYQEGIVYDLEGVVDPLAEWLVANGYVINERYPWLDIKCPWTDEHSETGPMDTGYSPLGWGYTDAQKGERWFHCFHDSCSDQKTKEFISELVELGAPRVAIQDPMGVTLSHMVLDSASNCWIDIRSNNVIKDQGFKTAHQHTVRFPQVGMRNGEEATIWKSVQAYTLLVRNPGLVKVYGTCYLPGGELLVGSDYERRLNTCQLPYYGHGPTREEHVTRFLDFISYLIPDQDDCEWFLKHLSSKAKDALYRGPAVFMHTNTKGIGRGTLGRILMKLWGKQNAREVTMSSLLKGLSGENKNDELETLWVIVPEVEDGSTGAAHYQRYEQG